MTLLFARAGSDLREIHSRSIHKIGVVVPAQPRFGLSLTGLVSAARRRLGEVLRARAWRRELESLGDTALADLGVSVRCGETRVYTSVPLGVVTGAASGTVPANTQRVRKIA
jgi:uncharacterized protein YjiS (DUF1127 family)